MTSTEPRTPLLHLPGAPPWVEVTHETCRGGRTLHTIVNRRTRLAFAVDDDDVFPDGTPGPELAAELESAGFIGPAALDVPADPAALPLWRRVLRFVATLDLPLARADRTVRRLHRAGLRHAFTPAAAAAQVALAVAGLVALVLVSRSPEPVELHVSAARVPVVLLLGLVAVAVHELAHALVIVHYGRSVDVVGFRLHLATPAFYVESVDALHLSRRQRLLQAAAGPWAEWLVTSVAALALLVAADGTAEVVLHRFVVLNAFNVVSNLLPFVGLDGALILADVIRVPDLAARSRGSVGRLVGTVAARRRPNPGQVGLATYAVANAAAAAALLAVSVWLWVNLFGDSVSGLWAAGPVGIAALVLAAFVLGRPAAMVVLPRVVEGVGTITGLVHDHRFRRSVPWRVAATRELRRQVPEVARLDADQLGALAGLLVELRRSRPPTPGARVVEVGADHGLRRPVRACLRASDLHQLLDGRTDTTLLPSTAPR